MVTRIMMIKGVCFTYPLHSSCVVVEMRLKVLVCILCRNKNLSCLINNKCILKYNSVLKANKLSGIIVFHYSKIYSKSVFKILHDLYELVFNE